MRKLTTTLESGGQRMVCPGSRSGFSVELVLVAARRPAECVHHDDDSDREISRCGHGSSRSYDVS